MCWSEKERRRPRTPVPGCDEQACGCLTRRWKSREFSCQADTGRCNRRHSLIEKRVRIVLLMKVPNTMNPITPLGVNNRQGMKCPETRKPVYLFIVCSLQNVLSNKRSDFCMHRRHGMYLKMSSTDSYLHVGMCVRDKIPRHGTDSQKIG